MASRELSCPVCNAYFPLSGDEQVGEEVYCSYCMAPCILRKSEEDPSELELEEDF